MDWSHYVNIVGGIVCYFVLLECYGCLYPDHHEFSSLVKKLFGRRCSGCSDARTEGAGYGDGQGLDMGPAAVF